MSTLNWWMLLVGLLIAKCDVLRRVYSSDSQRMPTAVQLIAVLDFVAPFVFMSLALLDNRVFQSDPTHDARRFSDGFLVLAFFMSLAASPVGVFALMVLSVNGSTGRDGWQQPATRRTLVLACLDVVHPVLLTSFVVMFMILVHFFGRVFSG